MKMTRHKRLIRNSLMFIISTFTTLAGLSLPVSAYNPETEALLCRLDSVVEKPEIWEGMKLHRISELHKKESQARTIDERYWLNKNLFEEYSVFNADSAMSFANRNLEISRQLDDKSRIIEWNINRSFILAVTGLLKEAQDIMESIDTREIPEDLKPQYFNQLAYLYSHYGQYLGNNANPPADYYVQSRAYQDSTFAHAVPSDPLYLWYKAWASEYHSDEKLQELKAELKAHVDSAKMDSRYDAMKAYALSDIYKLEKDYDNRIKYLALSAICDVKTANKDMASLEVLGKIMFSNNDIDRAYSYIDFCQKQAQNFHNRVRSLTLSDVEKKIREKYSSRDSSQRKRLQIYLWILSSLTAVLVVAVIIIINRNKKLNDSRGKLASLNEELKSNISELRSLRSIQEETNQKLKEMNDELCVVNNKLKESNLIKEEYVGQMFYICSDYINKIETIRKDVLRKLKAGQAESLQRSMMSPSMVQAELKEFHHQFDTIFLNIFPDFVKDFNKLLRPEEQITLGEGELLNTPLRIYALVRLGITDSVKIAALLHCSAQTVYNNRLRIRNKAIIPKENFAGTVRTLGKFQP